MKILALAGSTRQESFNRRLLKVSVEGARQAGAEVTLVDLTEYEMPLFDQDLEYREGVPDAAVELKQLLINHQGLLIASPEYNGFPAPLLKNTFDWLSRQQNGHEPPLFAFKGKVASIMSASPGTGGGARGLTMLRILLQNLGVMTLPEQVALGRAAQAFREDGRLHNDEMQLAVGALGSELFDMLSKQATLFD